MRRKQFMSRLKEMELLGVLEKAPWSEKARYFKIGHRLHLFRLVSNKRGDRIVGVRVEKSLLWAALNGHVVKIRPMSLDTPRGRRKLKKHGIPVLTPTEFLKVLTGIARGDFE